MKTSVETDAYGLWLQNGAMSLGCTINAVWVGCIVCASDYELKLYGKVLPYHFFKSKFQDSKFCTWGVLLAEAIETSIFTRQDQIVSGPFLRSED